MRVKLDEVCKRIYAGGDVPKDKYSEQKTDQFTIPIYANAEKNDGLYGYTDKARETELCITVAARGTIGYTSIRKEPFLPVVRLIVVVPDTTVISVNYLYYILKGLKPQSTGTSIPQLTVPDIKKRSIELYTLPEQETIAKKLSTIERLIEELKKELVLFDELVKARFVEMFGDPVINQFGWEQSVLKDIAIGKLSYGSGASAIDFDGSIRYVRITDITENGELNSEKKSPNSFDDKYVLNDGDILFARSGATVGKTFCYKQSRDGKCIYAGYLIRLVPNPSKVIPDYVYWYTKTDYYLSFVEKVQRAVAQPNINAQEYGMLSICIPPIELQKKFTKFVQEVDKSKFVVPNIEDT